MKLEVEESEIDMIADRFGAFKLRLLRDDNRIVSWKGKHLGFISDNAVYNYSGRHVGWYEGGIFRDTNGTTIGFGLNPIDTPAPNLPYQQRPPKREPIKTPPVIPAFKAPADSPYKQFGWSDRDIIGVFTDDE